MTKILLTGMSAPQASPFANRRTRSFAAVMHSALTKQAGYDVDWIDPDINWTLADLDKYDAVLVGVSPITSLSANRAYGALSVIDVLADSPKLTLFIDAPNPGQITSSLKAISETPSNLTKQFFSYRKQFDEASEPETNARLLSRVNSLLTEEWPITIYPSLPWKGEPPASLLPVGLSGRLYGINLDVYEIDTSLHSPSSRANLWSVDVQSPWLKTTLRGLVKPFSPMMWNKGWTDEQVAKQISESMGVLISSTKSYGTWWTNRYLQAMSTNTPVATEWRDTSAIGPAWSVLASEIESMTSAERIELAVAQRAAYLKHVPQAPWALRAFQFVLKLPTERMNR